MLFRFSEHLYIVVDQKNRMETLGWSGSKTQLLLFLLCLTEVWVSCAVPSCLHFSISPCLHVFMSPCLHVSMSPGISGGPVQWEGVQVGSSEEHHLWWLQREGRERGQVSLNLFVYSLLELFYSHCVCGSYTQCFLWCRVLSYNVKDATARE